MVLVFFFAIIILFIKVNINVDLIMIEKNKIEVLINIFKIIKIERFLIFQYDIQKLDFILKLKQKNKQDKTLFNFKKTNKKKKKVKNRFLVKAISLKQLNLKINLGACDAYSTAMLCGWINTIFESLSKVFISRKNISNTSFIIKPCYNSPIFNMSLNCIISFNLANIIYEFIKQKFKNKKRR